MIGTSSFRSVDPRFHGKSSDPTDPEVITDAELDEWERRRYQDGRTHVLVRRLIKALRAYQNKPDG